MFIGIYISTMTGAFFLTSRHAPDLGRLHFIVAKRWWPLCGDCLPTRWSWRQPGGSFGQSPTVPAKRGRFEAQKYCEMKRTNVYIYIYIDHWVYTEEHDGKLWNLNLHFLKFHVFFFEAKYLRYKNSFIGLTPGWKPERFFVGLNLVVKLNPFFKACLGTCLIGNIFL